MPIWIRDSIWIHIEQYEQAYDSKKYNIFPKQVYRTIVDQYQQYIKNKFNDGSLDDDPAEPIIFDWLPSPTIPFEFFTTYYLGDLLSFIHRRNNPSDQPYDYVIKLRYLDGLSFMDHEFELHLMEILNGLLQSTLLF